MYARKVIIKNTDLEIVLTFKIEPVYAKSVLSGEMLYNFAGNRKNFLLVLKCFIYL